MFDRFPGTAHQHPGHWAGLFHFGAGQAKKPGIQREPHIIIDQAFVGTGEAAKIGSGADGPNPFAEPPRYG
ncbi:MAG: hypothetical protein OXC13_03725 [Caldilineaceae bacterium]|nr:hypothetical protein [Caldilineaceae bacterium]